MKKLTDEQAEEIVMAYGDDWDNYQDDRAGEEVLCKDNFIEWRKNLSIDDVPEEFIEKHGEVEE